MGKSESDTELLKNFSDETLDEAFPPTAQEAAELEAAEAFVFLMANLDVLERKEEAIRLVRAGLKKRLEAKIGRAKHRELPMRAQQIPPENRGRARRNGELMKGGKCPMEKKIVKLPVKQPIQQ